MTCFQLKKRILSHTYHVALKVCTYMDPPNELFIFNCWLAIFWVMKCVWIQGVCKKSVPVWHSNSLGALQLIMLSNLVLMRCRMLVVIIYMTMTAANTGEARQSFSCISRSGLTAYMVLKMHVCCSVFFQGGLA